MSGNPRQTGGQSNKRGNRYEDYFVVFRLLQYAPWVIDEGAVVRLKEQNNCPVDDLLLKEPLKNHFHQLKTSPEITWTADGEKLQREFREQDATCRASGESYGLVLVVALEMRAELLREAMPQDLRAVTTVFHFPFLDRPAHLAGLEMLVEIFAKLRASRFPSRTADQAIAGAFFLAFAENEPDAESFCVLSQVLETIWRRSLADIRQRVPVTHPRWPEAHALLARIDDLELWIDRGYFEWRYRQADTGLIGPVNGGSFQRFVDRIVSQPPKTFADFEGLLP